MEEGDDQSRWLKVSKAERISGISKGVISRAVDSGDLKSNGKRGRERRIDSVDFIRWLQERVDKPERRESEAAIRRKLES